MPVCIVPILRNIVGVKAPPVQAHLPHGLLCPCLPLTLLSFLATWTFWNVGDQTPKIPKIEIIPTFIPKLWVFLGVKPQKFPNFISSPSPKYPQNVSGDFRGKNPKNPKFKLILAPEKSPKVVQGFASSPPRPRNLGRGRGKSGMGAPFYHTNQRDWMAK